VEKERKRKKGEKERKESGIEKELARGMVKLRRPREMMW